VSIVLRSLSLEASHAALRRLGSPLLPACVFFHDKEAPHLTYAISAAPRATTLRARLRLQRAVKPGQAGEDAVNGLARQRAVKTAVNGEAGQVGEDGVNGEEGVNGSDGGLERLGEGHSVVGAVLRALSSLHQLGIAHGSLNAEAVTMDADGEVRDTMYIIYIYL